MNQQPTNPAELLAYLIAVLAPYLISGGIIRQFAEMLPFIKNDDAKKEWPPFAKLTFVYGVCLIGAALNYALTGHYSGLDFGTAVTTTFNTATAVAGATQIVHFGPDVISSFGGWVSGLFSGVVAAITKVVHPNTTTEISSAAKGVAG